MKRSLPVRLGFILLWIFAFSMPFEKSIEVPGLGTISKAAGLLAFGGGLLAVAFERRLRVPDPIHIALAVFVSWSALTLRWSVLPEYTVELVKTYLQLLGLLWLVWELCTEERHVLSLFDAYLAGTLAPVIQTVQRFLSGKQTYYNRYAIEGFDPNDLALTLAIGLPMAYYLSLRRSGRAAWLYRLLMIALIGTIFLTGSRGGTLAMAVALSLLLWTLPSLSRRARIAVLAAGMAGAAAAIAVVPAASWKRIASLGSEIAEGTLNSRTVLWRAGWEGFGDAPFQGVGAGAFSETTVGVLGRPWGWAPVAHNSFLSVLVETGIIGFALFAFALALIVAGAIRMPGITGQFWMTLLAVWALGVFSLTWEYRKPTWLLFGLLAAHSAAWTRTAAARTRAGIPIALAGRAEAHIV